MVKKIQFVGGGFHPPAPPDVTYGIMLRRFAALCALVFLAV